MSQSTATKSNFRHPGAISTRREGVMDKVVEAIISTPKVDKLVFRAMIGWLVLLVLRQVWALV